MDLTPPPPARPRRGPGAAPLRGAAPPPVAALPWVRVADGGPYFVADDGAPWTPVGQNDALTWPDLAGLFRRRDLAAVEGHLAWLAGHGVTVLRLMLEYSHGRHRDLERPAGRFQPAMAQLWDDLVALSARAGLRLLLTPFDTFWMWRRWRHHPYNRRNGGPCASRRRWLTCPATRAAVKARLDFATTRWGGSGVVFAWDLWNEIHPAHAADDAGPVADFVGDVGGFLRERELALHGRAHLQTVSAFGPSLALDPRMPEVVFRHPRLDFATTHLYAKDTIDHPRDTVAAALDAGRLVREALVQTPPGRPYLDSEHGPIHAFIDRGRTLPEAFDDEYFRHLQWAHLASGGAGGGMRWPNRHPHVLTHGMRRAQLGLARFLPLVDWARFRRTNLNAEVALSAPGLAACACGDERQAVAWIVRTDTLGRDGRLRPDAPPMGDVTLTVPGLAPGAYRVTFWDTLTGAACGGTEAGAAGGAALRVGLPPLTTDLALAIRRSDG